MNIPSTVLLGIYNVSFLTPFTPLNASLLLRY